MINEDSEDGKEKQGETIIRPHCEGYGFQKSETVSGNQDEAVAHFGFGGHKGPFMLTVQFPSGVDVVLEEVHCCEMIEVIEPKK